MWRSSSSTVQALEQGIIFPVMSTEVKEFAALLASRGCGAPLILAPVWELVAWKINVQVPKLEARSI
jgi:hypothetical protein